MAWEEYHSCPEDDVWEWDWEPWEDKPAVCPRCKKTCSHWDGYPSGKKWVKENNGQWHRCKENLDNFEDL